MMKRMLHTLVCLSGILLATAAHAELRKVDQATFGMDCAPCAYGIERGLNGLEGVQNVEVSLNQAKAVVELAPGNNVTLDAIRQVIRDGGFSPREATIQVTGRLSLEQGRQQLVLASGERYRLAAEEGDQTIQQQLQSLEAGHKLLITGRVPPSETEANKPLILYAQRIEIQSASRR